MVFLQTIIMGVIALYICIAICVGLHSLVKHNNTDAPVFQLIFATVKGLAWPFTLAAWKHIKNANLTLSDHELKRKMAAHPEIQANRSKMLNLEAELERSK